MQLHMTGADDTAASFCLFCAVAQAPFGRFVDNGEQRYMYLGTSGSATTSNESG